MWTGNKILGSWISILQIPPQSYHTFGDFEFPLSNNQIVPTYCHSRLYIKPAQYHTFLFTYYTQRAERFLAQIQCWMCAVNCKYFPNIFQLTNYGTFFTPLSGQLGGWRKWRLDAGHTSPESACLLAISHLRDTCEPAIRK